MTWWDIHEHYLFEASLIDTYFSDQFCDVMGYLWVLSVRSVIVTYFSIGSNWLLKINWINWNILIVYLLMTWWDIYEYYLFEASLILIWSIFFLDCNGTDVLVRAIWVSIWLLIANKYHFFFFLTVSFFIHLILDFFSVWTRN